MCTRRTIALTAPCGNIGTVLLDRLHHADADIRAMSRNPQKLVCSPGLRKIAGEIHSLSDLQRLLEGADTLFWATPPDFQNPDLLDWYRRAGESAAQALRGSGVSRVVHLSSLGAEYGEESGLIYGHSLVEEALDSAAPNVLHLRSAYFMENFLTCLLSIGAESVIRRPVSPARSFPMVATSDVATIAAEMLIDTDWQGQHAIELLGPSDLSMAQASAILSEELGREIRYEQLEGQGCREYLVELGMGESMAGLLVRTYEWIESSAPDYAARRDPAMQWQFDFRSFVRRTFAPIYSSLS